MQTSSLRYELLREVVAVFTGDDERLNHFRLLNWEELGSGLRFCDSQSNKTREAQDLLLLVSSFARSNRENF
jgi:hypothetical protein